MRFIVAALALVVVIRAANAASGVAIVRTGSFHGDEVPAATAGRWHALVPEGAGAVVRNVHATISLEHDVIVDSDGETTGKRIDVKPRSVAEPIVLVRGIPGLTPGPVPTALRERVVDVGTPIDARLGTRSYRLSVRCVDDAVIESQRHQKCELRLASGLVDHKLFAYSAYVEGNTRYWAAEYPPTVKWAGDLDGDGRMDLLMDTSDHYNISETRLYLSSSARSGRVVAEAARFRSTGC